MCCLVPSVIFYLVFCINSKTTGGVGCNLPPPTRDQYSVCRRSLLMNVLVIIVVVVNGWVSAANAAGLFARERALGVFEVA